MCCRIWQTETLLEVYSDYQTLGVSLINVLVQTLHYRIHTQMPNSCHQPTFSAHAFQVATIRDNLPAM